MDRRDVFRPVLAVAALAGAALVALLATTGGGSQRVPVPRPAPRPIATALAPGSPASMEDQVSSGRIPADVPRTIEPPSGAGAWVRVVDPDGASVPDFALAAAPVTRGADGELSVLQARDLASDEEGLVDLAPLVARDPDLELVAFGCPEAPGVRLSPGALSADRLGASRAQASPLVATPRAVAPVRGIVVDEASGEPLPGYASMLLSWEEVVLPAQADREALRVHHGLRRPTFEWVTTDETGRFVSSVALPDARVHFLTWEHVFVDGEHRIGPNGAGIELRLGVMAGPVVLLDFDPPEGLAVTDFLAALRRDGNEHPVWGMGELAHPLDPYHGQRRGPGGNAAPVRPGERPWVRVPLFQADEPLPSYLVLESRDRRHYGSALVVDLARHAEEPLRIELATRDVLEVRVTWPPDGLDGSRLEMLSVMLTRRDELAADPLAGWDAFEWVTRAGDEPVTSERILGCSPGRHLLVAGKRRESWASAFPQRIELDVELPRAEALDLAPSLAPPLPKHRVIGILRTASGLPLDGEEGRAEVSWIRGSPAGSSRLEWSGGRAAFGLDGVPEGRARLELSWSHGKFPTVPEEVEFDAPCEPLDILVRDDVAAEEVVVRVLEPRAPGQVELEVGEGGRRIHESRRFTPDELVTLPDGRRAIELASGPYVAGTPVGSIVLSMDGHEGQWLSEPDVPPAGADGRRVVELVPRAGWSARVGVVEEQDGERRPVPGIVLAFDGVETEAADEDGRLVHRAGAPPERLSVATDGWELLDRGDFYGRGGVVAASGKFTLEDGELTVLVRRGER